MVIFSELPFSKAYKTKEHIQLTSLSSLYQSAVKINKYQVTDLQLRNSALLPFSQNLSIVFSTVQISRKLITSVCVHRGIVYVWFAEVALFNGISTFLGYLMLKPSL